MIIIRNNGGGRFLSEALPDLFLEQGIGEIEQRVWAMYYEELEEIRKSKKG